MPSSKDTTRYLKDIGNSSLDDKEDFVTFEPATLKTPRIVLVLTPANHLRQSNIELVREILEKGYVLLVVTTNYPYAILRKMYEQQGLDLSRISFVDAITRFSLGTCPDGVSNCTFVSSPGNLTDMGIAITEQIQAHPQENVCILFDSVSTMVLYLQSDHISRFIHFITSKLRLIDGSGAFLAVEKGLDPMLLTQLTTFVDTVDEVPAS
jgi:hypothetical protein